MILFNFNADAGPYPIIGPAPTFSGGGAGATAMGRNGLRVFRVGQPRFEWRLVNGVLRRMWILEDARTNGFAWSEALANGVWFKNNVTVSANAATAPDGSATADKIVENTATAAHVLNRNSYAIGAGSTNTFSVHLKAAERRHGRFLFISGGDGFYVFFDLDTGTITPLAVGAAVISGSSIVPVVDGWFRVSITGITNAGATAGTLHLNLGTTATAQGLTYAGDGTSGLLAWGLQHGSGSYVSTTSAPASVAAESLTFSPSWSSQAISQYERYINHATGALVENVTTGTATTLLSQPQLGRSYLNLIAATGTRDAAWFRANLA